MSFSTLVVLSSLRLLSDVAGDHLKVSAAVTQLVQALVPVDSVGRLAVREESLALGARNLLFASRT